MFEDDFQSYFGESDSNFFGDTSNDMIFGEGYGQPVTNGQQFFSEAAGFSSDGGEFISEATAFDMDGEVFTEAPTPHPNVTQISHETDTRDWELANFREMERAGKKAKKAARAKAKSEGKNRQERKAIADLAYDAATGPYQREFRSSRDAMIKHDNNLYAVEKRHRDDARIKAKSKAAGANPVDPGPNRMVGPDGGAIKQIKNGSVIHSRRLEGAHETSSKSNK